MLNMFWKEKKSVSLDEKFMLSIKKNQLKMRAMMACIDTTDYDLMLRNFCSNNKNNKQLLTNVVVYWQAAVKAGIPEQQAAKDTLEYFRH